MNPACPVCGHGATVVLLDVDDRRYWRCPACLATFVDPGQHPGREEEKSEYDRHCNAIDDPGYQQFLRPAFDALTQRVPGGCRILDYGCGPGPALANMLTGAGFQVSLYDPIYRPDSDVLGQRFDAIACTEVVEHFHRPAREFQRLDSLLRPGGWLVIMTRFQTDDARFARWHYRRDPTHVVFYRPQTFRVLGCRFGWQVECSPPNLVVIGKAQPG